MRNFSFFLLMILMSSCSSNDFPKTSLLGGLRVLALAVDQPYITNPSGNVTIALNPYVSDIGGSGDLTVAIQSCVDPGVSPSINNPDCTHQVNASAVQNVTISGASGQPVGIFGSPERTGSPVTPFSVTLNIPSGFLNAYSQQLQFNGVPYLITFKISNATTTLIAYRQIFISNQANDSNPGLSDIVANGASLTSLPASNASLGSTISSTPAPYKIMSASGIVSNAVQNYKIYWFVSDGSLGDDSSTPGGTVSWTVPSQGASGRKTVVVGVLRNGRGGESVIVRLL